MKSPSLLRPCAWLCIVCMGLAALLCLAPATALTAPALAGPIRLMGRDCGSTNLLSAFGPHAALSVAGTSHTWESDSDFLPGFFERTEVVSGSGRISLMRGWTANVKANNDAGAATQDQPSMAADAAGNIYAAWQDERNGNPDIFVAGLLPGRQAWGSAVKVNNDSAIAIQGNPSLAAGAAGVLYVAWEDRRVGHTDIYAARSTDGGKTWGANVKVNADLTTANQLNPSLVYAAGVLYVAWEDHRSGNGDIYAARSIDAGMTWSPNIKVNDIATGDQLNPALAIGTGKQLYVAWEDGRSGAFDIYAARSVDAGKTWSASVKINDSPDTTEHLGPSLAAGTSGMLLAAWQGFRRGVPGAYVAYSHDGGLTWSHSSRINDGVGATAPPGLAIDRDGTPYCFWCENRDNIDTIFVARSTDSGTSWNGPIRVSDDSSVASRGSPSLVGDGKGGAFIAWKDARDSNPDIYTSTWPDDAQFHADGAYLADVLDAGTSVDWRRLAWAATQPQGSAVVLAARAGDSPLPNSTWSAWITYTASPADLGTLPHSRYVQWRAQLSSATSTTTPGLEAVTLAWRRRLYLALVLR